MKVYLLLIGLVTAQLCLAVPPQIRVATYNASLNRPTNGQLASDLAVTTNAQAKKVAEILQRVRPDIVLINEFDYDAQGLSRERFHANYLAVSQNGQVPLNFPYRYSPPSNTGITSGYDLDNAGGYVTTPGADPYGNDCFGFGWFPGQYGFVVYSRFPIRTSEIRSFQLFLWKDMPGAAFPDISGTPAPADFYSTAEKAVLRLSSKNHCDIPIEIVPGQLLHLLASHPTPPSFDGSEDRNGRRNHDEIRLWGDYVQNASYLYDDSGARGGLAANQRFVVLADLNADPLDGDSYLGAINQLLQHPLINAGVVPSSAGGTEAARLQGGKNLTQLGDPAADTADFGDGGSNPGNLRVDHVLPSRSGLSPISGGVFWPIPSDPTSALIGISDHRLVYLDLTLTPIISEAVRRLTVTREQGNVVLAWQAQPGVTYNVQTSMDLFGWADAPQIGVTINPTTQSARAIDSAPGGAAKYYRLVTALEGT